ncbi:MAG: type II toxin-antitoxin system VapC family toxin [Saccharofermentans sp.]|nr:type II toxin-antitoxin system VapC family toxin [Saccharofermentans sp.]
MRYMLDTNICIYIIKHKPESVYRRLMKIRPEDVCISSITYSELSYGVEKSEQKDRNRLALTLMLSNIEILEFDTAAAEEYGNIRARLEKTGTPIGSLDMLIAAHAKASGCTLVTNNLKEFSRVEGLKVESWVSQPF